ncbi:MAG: helix-turn-helix transcriptional regulator [Pseudonocardia sp.]
MTITQDLMRDHEAAAMLAMAAKTLANKRSRGEGPPYVRLSGGAIRYSRKAVQRWIEQNTVTPGGAA